MNTSAPTRRSILFALGSLVLPRGLWAGSNATPQRLRFGLCADVHKDVMHDADGRLQIFIDKATESRADFILQLGDFCTPKEQNRPFMKVWESFDGPRYHTLGNHDTDGGFTADKALQFWGIQRRYYSFDRGGRHFVVLDGNEKKPGQKAGGYSRYIGAEQLAWLAEDLGRTDAPTLLFSHQSLEDVEGVQNAADVRGILERANAKARWRKVGVCFSGHHHIDFHAEINGIHYVQINSMAYSWLGSKYAHVRYGPENDKAFPYIKYTAPYRDPLFAMVDLSPDGTVQIEGVRSEFVGPSPWELGLPEQTGTARQKDRMVPRISDRRCSSQNGVLPAK